MTRKCIGKGILAGLCAAAIALMEFSCGDGKVSRERTLVDSLLEANSMTEGQLREYVDVVNAISQSLDYIQQAESALTSSTTVEGTPKDRREAIKEQIRNLGDVLQEQRARIAELESRLRSEGAGSTQLQSVISMLKAQVEEKDRQIAALQEQVEQQKGDIVRLTGQVSTLATTVSEQEEALVTQSDMMNEAYVYMGTKKELRDAGLLSGGFLRKTTVNFSNIDKSQFQAVDIRYFTEIEVPSAKVSILSQMPSGSYRLTTSGSTTTLTVLDATAFWSISNFLIIQTQ